MQPPCRNPPFTTTLEWRAAAMVRGGELPLHSIPAAQACFTRPPPAHARALHLRPPWSQVRSALASSVPGPGPASAPPGTSTSSSASDLQAGSASRPSPPLDGWGAAAPPGGAPSPSAGSETTGVAGLETSLQMLAASASAEPGPGSAGGGGGFGGATAPPQTRQEAYDRMQQLMASRMQQQQEQQQLQLLLAPSLLLPVAMETEIARQFHGGMEADSRWDR